MSKELAQIIQEKSGRDLSYTGELPSQDIAPLSDDEIENARRDGPVPISVDSWQSLWEDYRCYGDNSRRPS